jgi:hypothetical protein
LEAFGPVVGTSLHELQGEELLVQVTVAVPVPETCGDITRE